MRRFPESVGPRLGVPSTHACRRRMLARPSGGAIGAADILVGRGGAPTVPLPSSALPMRFFWKLLALVAGLAISVLVVSSTTFFLTATDLLIEGVGREAIRLAGDASNVLNTKLVATVLAEPDDTLEWRLLVSELADIQSEQGLAGVENVYLLASVDGVLRVLADPTGDDAALVVADTVLVDVKRAVLRTRDPEHAPEAYADEYGTWMSGYVPLSSEGQDLPVLLAVDLPLGAVLLSRRLTRPVTNLTEAMTRVRGGDYAASVAITSSDEIGEMSQAFNELLGELEEKARLRSIVDRSVSTAVADKLLSEGLTLTGEMREITALFADIRGFTSLVESLPARGVVQMLNEYFGALIPCVQRHGGVVDKLIGDEVFAVFGAPADHEDDARGAVRAALDMKEALETVNRAREARGDLPITFGVGMNSGSAVAGGLGADTHLEYTVVGRRISISSSRRASTVSISTSSTRSSTTRIRAPRQSARWSTSCVASRNTQRAEREAAFWSAHKTVNAYSSTRTMWAPSTVSPRRICSGAMRATTLPPPRRRRTSASAPSSGRSVGGNSCSRSTILRTP